MTRQTGKISEKKVTKLVDTDLGHPLGSKDQLGEVGQGRERKGTKINEDVWSEFILVAHHILGENEDAEIADVFEFFRRYDLGGEEYSPSLLKRVTREVETECGPF